MTSARSALQLAGVAAWLMPTGQVSKWTGGRRVVVGGPGRLRNARAGARVAVELGNRAGGGARAGRARPAGTRLGGLEARGGGSAGQRHKESTPVRRPDRVDVGAEALALPPGAGAGPALSGQHQVGHRQLALGDGRIQGYGVDWRGLLGAPEGNKAELEGLADDRLG